jgi:hypothetical protein
MLKLMILKAKNVETFHLRIYISEQNRSVFNHEQKRYHTDSEAI